MQQPRRGVTIDAPEPGRHATALSGEIRLRCTYRQDRGLSSRPPGPLRCMSPPRCHTSSSGTRRSRWLWEGSGTPTAETWPMDRVPGSSTVQNHATAFAESRLKRTNSSHVFRSSNHRSSTFGRRFQNSSMHSACSCSTRPHPVRDCSSRTLAAQNRRARCCKGTRQGCSSRPRFPASKAGAATNLADSLRTNASGRSRLAGCSRSSCCTGLRRRLLA